MRLEVADLVQAISKSLSRLSIEIEAKVEVNGRKQRSFALFLLPNIHLRCLRLLSIGIEPLLLL